MSKRQKRDISDPYIDLCILRLAAMALDVRGQLQPHELRKVPSLESALSALEAVLDELGWDNMDDAERVGTSK